MVRNYRDLEEWTRAVENPRSDAGFLRFLRIVNDYCEKWKLNSSWLIDLYRTLFKQCNDIGRLLSSQLRSLSGKHSDDWSVLSHC